MKNVTLSMPEDLLERARKYALERGTTLNQMIRDLLKEEVESPHASIVQEMQALYKSVQIDTKSKRFNRDEAHER